MVPSVDQRLRPNTPARDVHRSLDLTDIDTPIDRTTEFPKYLSGWFVSAAKTEFG